MKFFRLVAVWVALLLPVSASHADQAPYPATEEALQAEYEGMPWSREPGTYTLEKSNSSIRLPEGLSILMGDAARRTVFLSQGTEFPDTEALVFDDATMTVVMFEYFDEGYITVDDWSDLDPVALLEEVAESTELGNADRRDLGIPALTVKGWSKKPTLDHSTNTVMWAIAAQEEGDPALTVNAIVFRLGRRGYEKLTWVGSATQYANSSDNLIHAVLNGHTFDSGFGYADYQSGDMVSVIGIGALVAATVGATSTKSKGFWAGLLVLLIGFAKKGWILIVLAVGGAWAVMRRTFGGGRSQQKPPPSLE